MKRKSLAEEKPELLAQWAKRNELNPADISCGSHKKVWWRCDKGHVWQATVKNRALKGSGCPYCEHRAILKGYNDLQTVNPELASTWSPKNSLKPSDVPPSSNTVVLWNCENGHEWSARVADRTEGHGCPYCAGHRVWKGFNDLATTHPNLVSEWSDKNQALSPETITYKNRTNIWWHCNKCGKEYQAVIYAKANGRHFCPFCVASRISKLRERRLANKRSAEVFSYLLPRLASIYYAEKRGLAVSSEPECLVGIPVMAYIPEIALIIDSCSSKNEIQVSMFLIK
jgi:DNA-directed RNA polymerase subunit RPC12/RpoP